MPAHELTKLSFTQVDSYSHTQHLPSLFSKHDASFGVHTVDV